MRFQSHQALITLVHARLSELEYRKEELLHGVQYWLPKCDPHTEEGVEAYAELNRMKNRLRSVTKQISSWVAVIKDLKRDLSMSAEEHQVDSRLLAAFATATSVMNNALKREQ